MSQLTRNERMALLHREGMSFSAIAREYGISRQRVHQIVHAQGQENLTRARWEASAEAMAQYREEAARQRAASAQVNYHGTRSRYMSGCRCAHCTRANTDYAREQRANARGVMTSGT